jgi:hypothetical protein
MSRLRLSAEYLLPMGDSGKIDQKNYLFTGKIVAVDATFCR